MKLSIAIPTLNSSEFIDDCINSVRKISNVDEIIINDDGSNELDYSILERKVEKLISSYNLNISLYRNEKNLGGFKNKYVTISKCTNDYVYQIDSDNLAGLNTNKILNDTFLSNLNGENFYLPSKVYVFKKNPYLSSLRKKYKVLIANKKFLLDKKEISKSMTDDEKLFVDVKNRWVFNLGNFIVNREYFLERMKIGFESKDLPLAADPIAMCYFWLKEDGKLQLIENFYHFHRLRPNSYWYSAGQEATKSVEYFEKKIANLNND